LEPLSVRKEDSSAFPTFEIGPKQEDVMPGIEAGLRGMAEMRVARPHLASTLGNIGAEVLSTPSVALLMEQASRSAIADLLPRGKMTVGISISLRHFAATPLGQEVRAESELIKVEGRKLLFHVAVRDEVEAIAEGEIQQMIVSVDKFLSKVREKQGVRSV
jgi:fluoroacetyl-CoA thioesterase